MACGTFTRANFVSPVSGFFTSTARFRERFERNGNGWPGSTASGVRTGRTFRRKCALAASRCCVVRGRST